MSESDIDVDPQAPTTGEAKAEHLVLIVNESSRGHDILGGSSSEGAILLNDDEDDVIELAVMIEEMRSKPLLLLPLGTTVGTSP